MVQKKFSKDTKVKLVSLKDFLELSNYLFDVKKHLWKEGEKPNCGFYYKITPRLLILINYTWTKINFGIDFSEKLDYIQVAFRDGKTEYELFDKRVDELFEEKKKHKKNKRIDEFDYVKNYV